MVPQLSALSLALCHEALEGGGYQQMGTSKYAKRNFPSCSLRSQFTAEEPMPVGGFSTVFLSFAFHISLYSFPFFDFRYLLFRGVKPQIGKTVLVPTNFENRFLEILCWYPHVLYYSNELCTVTHIRKRIFSKLACYVTFPDHFVLRMRIGNLISIIKIL